MMIDVKMAVLYSHVLLYNHSYLNLTQPHMKLTPSKLNTPHTMTITETVKAAVGLDTSPPRKFLTQSS